ncbi:integrase [Advenella kashmirensis W13003]|uniref:Integrase n=2 Tax=Advenella kashmirensis TaxID=310575 RepID=V8QLM0_9BURK|nr:integrase [Advenella kashmirensis W13003]
MGRKRNAENRGLPSRWRLNHGAYYYQVPPGLETLWDGKKMFRLGTALSEAYKVWAARLEHNIEVRSIDNLLDRYLLEVVPTKAVSTHEQQRIWVRQLRGVFGKLPITGMKPRLVYRYVDARSKKKTTVVKDEITGMEKRKVTGGRVAAHREIEVLSHAFTKAVEWGYLDRHPFKGEVRLRGELSRDRYIEDWEIIEALSLPSQRKKGSVLAIQAYMRIKLMTGMARSDLLRLRLNEHIKDDGIHIQRHKTENSSGKRTIYEWTPELKAAVEQAKFVRPVLSPMLFCNKYGRGYIDEETGNTDGWDSMWQRFMERVLTETKVIQRFTEHDMRAKCASDAITLEHARALLSHADARTTNKIYRRKPERVGPLKGVA